MKVYSNESGFTDQLLKQIYLHPISNCANVWEKGFHVLNYLGRKCKFDEKDFLIDCPNKLFCADFHSDDYGEIVNKSISQFNIPPFYRELSKSLI